MSDTWLAADQHAGWGRTRPGDGRGRGRGRPPVAASQRADANQKGDRRARVVRHGSFLLTGKRETASRTCSVASVNRGRFGRGPDQPRIRPSDPVERVFRRDMSFLARSELRGIVVHVDQCLEAVWIDRPCTVFAGCGISLQPSWPAPAGCSSRSSGSGPRRRAARRTPASRFSPVIDKTEDLEEAARRLTYPGPHAEPGGA